MARDNRIITVEQWYGMLSNLDVLSLGAGVYYFMGREVVMGDHRVLLFDHCEYCGGRTLDKRDCCTQCGAPALRDRIGGQ